MLKDQDFPISIEVQLLGGLSDGKPRSTANLCTPGIERRHERQAAHRALHQLDVEDLRRRPVGARRGRWCTATSCVQHFVEGEMVLEYTKPQIGGGAVEPVDPAVKIDGTPMTGGYISIQAETAPADFRKIELLNLEGCMDPKASNYKTYFVKADPKACRYTAR